jgi:hypothetical protein
MGKKKKHHVRWEDGPITVISKCKMDPKDCTMIPWNDLTMSLPAVAFGVYGVVLSFDQKERCPVAIEDVYGMMMESRAEVDKGIEILLNKGLIEKCNDDLELRINQERRMI